MRTDIFKRLRTLEAESYRETITLRGAPWIPKIPLLDMFVFLMECECRVMSGESSADLTPELLAEAEKWAEYDPIPNDPPFHRMMADMARNLLESEKK